MNAVLRTDGTLMLVAQTISIAQSATISASGTTATAPKGGANGNYESGGGANADHAMPHPGVPGAATCTLAAYGCAPVSGGKGGGMLALVARRILVAGTLAADGTVGPAGANGGEASPDSGPYSPGPGGGGGSGGGILLAATEAQVRGKAFSRYRRLTYIVNICKNANS